MRLIAVEEHAADSPLARATREPMMAAAPAYYKSMLPELPYFPARGVMKDIGEGRLADMDQNGIDMQVLLTSGAQWLGAAEAIGLARSANDHLAESVNAHPDRLAGFATLPTADPDASAAELERAVTVLGLKGAAMIGRPGDRFLDDPGYTSILETASRLDVPIYLHPGLPHRSVQEAYYEGLDPVISGRFMSFGWGWHAEVGVHILRMILAGVFDRFPDLKLMAGHWGEMVPFFLDRLDEAMPCIATRLEHSISYYYKKHVYVSPSGMFTLPHLMFTMDVMGADHILFSVDYPFIGNKAARSFLEEAPISQADKEKIAFRNAEKLLKIPGV